VGVGGRLQDHLLEAASLRSQLVHAHAGVHEEPVERRRVVRAYDETLAVLRLHPPVEHTERERSELLDRLDPETLARLERLRRGL
jgi:hypothetical protein